MVLSLTVIWAVGAGASSRRGRTLIFVALPLGLAAALVAARI
jgi:hypothetical protein